MKGSEEESVSVPPLLQTYPNLSQTHTLPSALEGVAGEQEKEREQETGHFPKEKVLHLLKSEGLERASQKSQTRALFPLAVLFHIRLLLDSFLSTTPLGEKKTP